MKTHAALKEELSRGKEVSIIALLERLIEHAHAVRASDIHIDPSAKDTNVRLRIDGVLHPAVSFPKSIHSEVISRIKVLSQLRLDEHAAAHDGRFRIAPTQDKAGRHIDIRVSIAPTYHGENAVMRLLADKQEDFTLETMGFSVQDREKISAALERSSGMILATGPTGSGKTTTLYTFIKMINGEDISIVTIEDPIEYAVEGIKQIQVNHNAGLTFGSGLRSILRQDPNVIMVGEIRDAETAGIAVNTALTGHLLLSTVHTSDAATTVPRLLDMKIEPYLVASTLAAAIAQRLVRRICASCKRERSMEEGERKQMLAVLPQLAVGEGAVLYEGAGCDACGGTGFRGRVAVNEVLCADPEVRDAIINKATAAEIKKIAVRNGMTTMLEDGMYKALEGQTTLGEVLRVIHE